MQKLYGPHKKKCDEIGKNTENSNKDGARFGRRGIRGKIKRNTTEERRKRGDLITIYKLMNNLEETDKKI